MKTISLTSLGIAGAMGAIQKHFDEQIAKAAKPKSYHPDFQYTLDRTLDGQGEIEVAVEVTYYRADSEHKGWIDHRDPAFSPGEVQFGDAIDTATGETVTLTPLEWEQVEAAFWN